MFDVTKTKTEIQELSELCLKIELVTATMRYHVRLFSIETFHRLYFSRPLQSLTDLTQNTTASAPSTSPNKFNENNGCARSTYIILGTLLWIPRQITDMWTDQFSRFLTTGTHCAYMFAFLFGTERIRSIFSRAKFSYRQTHWINLRKFEIP